MYIQVEIKVGVTAFGVCPCEKGPDGKTAVQNLVLGMVTEIKNVGKGLGERQITITTESTNSNYHNIPNSQAGYTATVPEWRVSEFDFGGVPMINPWFDPKRIEYEDTKTMGFNPHKMIPIFP